MSEHTPGPWRWGKDYKGLYGQGEGRRREVLTFEQYEGMWLSYTANREANARLIAAAPLMYQALEEIANNAVKNYEGSMDIYPEAIAVARDALKAAKGDDGA